MPLKASITVFLLLMGPALAMADCDPRTDFQDGSVCGTMTVSPFLVKPGDTVTVSLSLGCGELPRNLSVSWAEPQVIVNGTPVTGTVGSAGSFSGWNPRPFPDTSIVVPIPAGSSATAVFTIRKDAPTACVQVNGSSAPGPWVEFQGNFPGSFWYLAKPLAVDAPPPPKACGCPNKDGTISKPGTVRLSKSGTAAVAEPISLGPGILNYRATDYRTAGQNPLAFTRSYNSQLIPGTLATTLGVGWRSLYDRYLQIALSGSQPVSVIAERADGQGLTFSANGASWVSDSDVDVQLTRSGSTWTLIDGSDTVETYTAVSTGPSTNVGLLTSIQARNGYTQTLSYNASNQLVAVSDSYGRTLSLTYQAGLLATVTTPDGLVLSYGYAASGNSYLLASVSYSTSPVTSLQYLYEIATFPFGLTGIIDEIGNRLVTWTYDVVGRATSNQFAGGAALTTVAYHSDGTRTVTNALGQQEVYTFTTLQGVSKVTQIQRLASAGVAAATRTFTYDANGYVTSDTDWNGNKTTYVNDSHGQPTTITDAVGTAQQRITTISYHPTFHVPLQIVAPGLTTNLTYDSQGNLLTLTEIDTTTNTTPYSTNGQSRTWAFTWSNFLLASVQEPRTDVTQQTQFGYDSSGALVAVTDPLGHVTHVTQHLPGGWPQTIVDPNGVTTTRTYNPRQWLVSRTISTAGGPLTTTFAYDAAGNVIQTARPDGSALAYTYDAAHRPVAIADLFSQQIAYTLDALGDRTAINVVSSGNTVTGTRSANFDALGRMVKDIGGVGQTATFAYDSNGNSTTITDPLARVTTQAFDALNRRTRITDPANGLTTFAYDAQDRLVNVTDPNGHATTYVYDGFGNRIQVMSPDSGTTVYRYDLAGNRVQRVDAAGAVANYAYDALNRLTAVTYPGDAAENVTYRYDEAGHGFGIGRLTTVVDAVGTLQRSYDERGNLVSETRSGGSWTAVTGYAYDAASRITAITYPSGTIASYTRDAMGRVTAITAQPPGSPVLPVLSSITYLPFGPVQGLHYGNGVVETRTFDLDYRQTGLSASGGSALQQLTYGYNAADNVVSITDGVAPGQNQSFGYDVLDRLTSAIGGYGASTYTYDPVGNVLTQTGPQGTQNFNYVAGSNRLAAVTAGSTLRQFDYTPTGNIAQDDQPHKALSLSYNHANRLASVGPVNDAAPLFSTNRYQYTYDAFGQRLLKSRAWITTKTLYQYDQAGHLLEESTVSAGGLGSQVEYVYLDNRPIARLTSSGLAFLHGDRLDTPQIATGPAQNVLWQAAYQPFGQTQLLTNTITQNLRFPGQYADAETGYDHNGFRTYDPTLGRYLQSDPIGLAGGINPYAYVSNNPVNFIDPEGTVAPLLWWLLAAEGAAYVGSNWYEGGNSFNTLTTDIDPETLKKFNEYYEEHCLVHPDEYCDRLQKVRTEKLLTAMANAANTAKNLPGTSLSVGGKNPVPTSQTSLVGNAVKSVPMKGVQVPVNGDQNVQECKQVAPNFFVWLFMGGPWGPRIEEYSH